MVTPFCVVPTAFGLSLVPTACGLSSIEGLPSANTTVTRVPPQRVPPQRTRAECTRLRMAKCALVFLAAPARGVAFCPVHSRVPSCHIETTHSSVYDYFGLQKQVSLYNAMQ